MPAAMTPEAVYAQKRLAYQHLETGCHYPTREEWFEKTDRHKRLDWRPYFRELPDLTPRQRQLYGLERYAPCVQDAAEEAEAHTIASPSVQGEAEETHTTGRSSAQGACSKKLPCSVPGPVPGLEIAQATAETAKKALLELRPCFQTRTSGKKSSSDMFEVGWSFHLMEKDNIMQIASPLTDFPCLQGLLLEVMSALGSSVEDLGEETLNIICRRYTRRQDLPKHIDRPGLFEEDVYGCVLQNTSDQRLSFEQQTNSGELIAGPHYLDEQPGACFRQRGEARYDWVHGVDELQRGERVSITWRWIKKSRADEARQSGGKGKGESKGKRKDRKAEAKGAKKGKDAVHEKEGALEGRAKQGNSSGTMNGEISAVSLSNVTHGVAGDEVQAPEQAPKKRWGRR
jgi:hypothetical protein